MVRTQTRAHELTHSDLLELDAEGGTIRFAGQRALLLDAMALGILRQYLVENVGPTASRTVLTQFGFAHGWRMAAGLKDAFDWASPTEWHAAGRRIHNLAGLFCAQPGSDDPVTDCGATLLASYEAEQHILHFGASQTPACWTIAGLLSGYASRTSGKEIYVLEDRCLAQGHAACHLRGRTRAEWGEARREDLVFFGGKRLAECLDLSLASLIAKLQDAEKKLSQHQKVLRHIAPEAETHTAIVAKSTKMKRAVDLARRVAVVDTTVLLTGESGVGKERIARLIHEESARAAGPFLAVNCGAITETLLESELFGHKRGAFTGATADRAGLFEAANNGTLLLDEIGEMAPMMQVKLLRVLQEREVRRVGENTSRPINVRVLAATNRDLSEQISAGAFRADLFYRINVVEVCIPALRERKDDILQLAKILLADTATRMHRHVVGFTPAAANKLLEYDWPGNVRELQNAIERAVTLTRGSLLTVDDFPREVEKNSHQAISFETRDVVGTGAIPTLEQVEKQHILRVLALNGGNQTHAAQQLEIGSATLYRKLKSYRHVEQDAEKEL